MKRQLNMISKVHKKNRPLCVLALLLLVMTAQTAWAESLGVNYIDANGELQNTATDGIDGNDSPTVLTNGTDVSNIAGGWYVVTGDVSYSNHGINCGSGDMHLILADGAKLTANGFILGDGNLTIYAQSTGDGMGELSSTGGVSSNTGNITICGGKITASGQYADIHADGTVTIHSGRVTASADENGIYGIYAKKNVILGLRNATDFINASGFSGYSGSISIAAGQALTDGTNTYTSETASATLAALTNVTLTPTWEGSGTSASDPYLIKSTTQLNLLAQRVNAGNDYENTYFQLGDDITYTYTTAWNDATSTENNYTAIGCYGHSFGGHFDGNGKTISGIRIYKGGDKFQGLFGNNFKAEVKNVILADARITGYTRTGGIVGFNSSSTVSGCHVGSDVSILVVQDNAQDIGGIAGGCYYPAEVSGCTSAASITTTASNTIYIGGIVGYNENSTVTDCLYLGSNLNGNKQVGAIVGRNYGSIIKNSYYTSTTITGKDDSGNELANASCAIGLDYGTITNCGLTQNTITIGTGVALTNATDYTVNGTGLTGYGDFALSYNNGTTTNIYALAGATVTINYNGGAAIPAGKLLKVSYIDDNYVEKEAAVTDNQNGTYSFTMPAYNVTAAVYNDFSLCQATVPNPTYSGTDMPVTYFYDGTWNANHGGMEVRDPQGNLLTYGTDYGFTMETLENLATKYPEEQYPVACSHLGENCRVYLKGCGEWAGTLYKDVVIISKPEANGTWGNNLSWNFKEGTLTIKGSGVMSTAQSNGFRGYPWYPYASYINTVILDDGITTIANEAFGGTNNENPYGGVQYIARRYNDDYWGEQDEYGKLPTQLESIGDNAFAYCTALTFNLDDILTNTKVTLDNISQATPFNQVAKIIGTLYDGKDNDKVFNMMVSAQKADVTIKGRTLYKDGDWNTLCLPFEVALEGSPLEGATVMQLDVTGIYDDKQTGLDGSTLNLYFKSATSIEPGVPCLVKWATTGDPLTDDLVFNDVKVHSGMNNVTSQDGKVTFKGLYSPVSWTEENKSILYLGAANKLYWPQPADADHPVSLNAFRAYFEASPDPSEGGEQAALQIYMNFEGEGETTGIVEAEANSSLFTIHSSLSEWHTINGVKLSGKPTKPGLYINNGRKVVVK